MNDLTQMTIEELTSELWERALDYKQAETLREANVFLTRINLIRDEARRRDAQIEELKAQVEVLSALNKMIVAVAKGGR